MSVAFSREGSVLARQDALVGEELRAVLEAALGEHRLHPRRRAARAARARRHARTRVVLLVQH